jgi:hypothetical protein
VVAGGDVVVPTDAAPEGRDAGKLMILTILKILTILSIYKCDHSCVFKEGHLPLLPPATEADD